MGIDRDAAPIVTDDHGSVDAQGQIDAIGMPGHGFVHGIIQHLRNEMMKRALIRAANIHAGTPANRFQPFQNLDILGGIVGGLSRVRLEKISHARSMAVQGSTAKKR